jgi:hypothetical protein
MLFFKLAWRSTWILIVDLLLPSIILVMQRLGEQVIESPQDLDSGTVGQDVECHVFQRERLLFQREQQNSESLICLSLDREDVLDTLYTSSI